MSEYVIETQKICCKAGYRYLLRDVSWQVKPGEHWVVFGMNGSGKTTLLSIIAGFKQQSSGKTLVFGEEYTNENILPFRQKIGWISTSFFDKYYTQESALNIVLSGKHGSLGVYYDINLDDVRLAKNLLSDLGLGDKINRGFDMLSKGERQNVLIARALFSNPDILILDEPCTGLDVYNRSYLFSTIDKLSQKKNLTIIYVTHYVEEITPLFDKTLLLKNGRIYAKGATKDLFVDETMSNFLGYPVAVEQEKDGSYQLKVETESNIGDILQSGEARA